jgi:hypothetical protein
MNKSVYQILKDIVKAFVYYKKYKKQKKLGYYLIDVFLDYIESINGIRSSFYPIVNKYVLRKRNLSSINKLYGDLLCMFIPDYEKNLYRYYKEQEYLILLTFISYPFLGPLSLYSYFLPYRKAAKKFDKLRIIDYGAGIPYGLIDLLMNQPGKIETVTLIDLNLMHVEFLKFLLSRISPGLKINFLTLNNTNEFPDIPLKNNNFLFGKNVFEHLHQPENKLKRLLSYADDAGCLCYFDFKDHGIRYQQHVTPDITYLSQVMIEKGFKKTGLLKGLSEYIN